MIKLYEAKVITEKNSQNITSHSLDISNKYTYEGFVLNTGDEHNEKIEGFEIDDEFIKLNRKTGYLNSTSLTYIGDGFHVLYNDTLNIELTDVDRITNISKVTGNRRTTVNRDIILIGTTLNKFYYEPSGFIEEFWLMDDMSEDGEETIRTIFPLMPSYSTAFLLLNETGEKQYITNNNTLIESKGYRINISPILASTGVFTVADGATTIEQGISDLITSENYISSIASDDFLPLDNSYYVNVTEGAGATKFTSMAIESEKFIITRGDTTIEIDAVGNVHITSNGDINLLSEGASPAEIVADGDEMDFAATNGTLDVIMTSSAGVLTCAPPTTVMASSGNMGAPIPMPKIDIASINFSNAIITIGGITLTLGSTRNQFVDAG